MEQAKINHEGMLNLEQPLIKVPLEQLKRALRTSQKHVEKEMLALSTQVESVISKASSSASLDEICTSLDASISRLHGLKRKLDEIKIEEDLYVHHTKVRLEHLAEVSHIQVVDSEAYIRWSKTRLARILVDYMLRQGLSTSAVKLATDSQIQDLVDIDLFSQSRKIEAALLKKSCNECLQWCSDNRSSLKKAKSTLEFNLRLQEYIELVRVSKTSQAIAYARKYLTPWSDTHMQQIQQAMGLLAFTSQTTCKSYKLLFDESQWTNLVLQFKTDNYALNSLTLRPLLHMTLQAGLASLKTPTCSQPLSKNVNCPVCESDTFGKLAEKLPCSHHVNSCVVCRISGKIMDADNPPLVLPNGQVYSTLALKDIASRNDGSILCPTTGATYHLTETRKAFIA
ncbi:GID complex subunit containing RING finger motif [Batrachochytrium dendrobatidis]|nr:GID complex subunit containing RING finger motif [Batrachochytrium dendrobatidis]